jgi:hypothetical protein
VTHGASKNGERGGEKGLLKGVSHRPLRAVIKERAGMATVWKDASVILLNLPFAVSTHHNTVTPRLGVNWSWMDSQ